MRLVDGPCWFESLHRFRSARCRGALLSLRGRGSSIPVQLRLSVFHVKPRAASWSQVMAQKELPASEGRRVARACRPRSAHASSGAGRGGAIAPVARRAAKPCHGSTGVRDPRVAKRPQSPNPALQSGSAGEVEVDGEATPGPKMDQGEGRARDWCGLDQKLELAPSAVEWTCAVLTP